MNFFTTVTECKESVVNQPLREGDYVVIVKYKDNVNNYYKGYTGLIKHYIQGSEHALVLLEAMTHPKCVKFNVHHLKKIE